MLKNTRILGVGFICSLMLACGASEQPPKNQRDLSLQDAAPVLIPPPQNDEAPTSDQNDEQTIPQCSPFERLLLDGRCVPDPCGEDSCNARGVCSVDLNTGAGRCECEFSFAGLTCESCAEGLTDNNGKCVARILFALPVQNTDGALIDDRILGVDHDPAAGSIQGACLSYDGGQFPACYDGHSGNDFFLAGGFEAMDAGSARVLAAASGVVVEVEDQNFDRCSLDILAGSVQCPGYGNIVPDNLVVIEHSDGSQARYLHLMTNSAVVQVGDDVECGDVLGLLGSSGNSAAPNLHFEVRDSHGAVYDPFAGAYSQDASFWVQQEAEFGLPSSVCQ